MSYTTMFGDTFEDEHDEKLCHRFGDTYKYFKKQYPGLHKLPTDEIKGICREFYKYPKGDTVEKSLARTNQYIEDHMPDWLTQYINPKKQQAKQTNNLSVVQDTVKDWANSFADITQAATVGYTTGATFGNLDEAMGLGTAITTFNPKNYTLGRDATRQLQNDLQQRHPYIYGSSELLGAVNSPVRLFKVAKTAPLTRHQTARMYNTFADTTMAIIGYSDLSDPYDVAINAAKIAAGNTLGYKAGKHMLGRGEANLGRAGYNITGNAIVNGVTDRLKEKFQE